MPEQLSIIFTLALTLALIPFTAGATQFYGSEQTESFETYQQPNPGTPITFQAKFWGNSMATPAFESIELLRDYRRAQRAIAKRWTTPLRFILVGGKYGDKVIMPTQKMITTIRDQINKMDLKSGLVVPFYVHAETYGTEGQVLNTEDKVKEVKEDIIVALGVAKSLVTGDGPNFATASIAFQKMVIMLKEIKQVAREILDWIFEDWKEMKGYGEKNLQYIFSDIDLTNEVEVKKLLIELYDRNLISKNTIQTKMDLNPDVEKSNRKKEGTLVDMSWDIKDIVALVQMGVMSVETAREMLGLEEGKESGRVKTDVKTESEGMYASAEVEKVCDDCVYLDGEGNRCLVTGEERRFNQNAAGDDAGGGGALDGRYSSAGVGEMKIMAELEEVIEKPLLAY